MFQAHFIRSVVACSRTEDESVIFSRYASAKNNPSNHIRVADVDKVPWRVEPFCM